MFDISSLMTSKAKETEGVWMPIGNEAKVKVARIGNDEYQKLLRRKYRANRAVLEQEDDLAAKVSEDVMIDVMAHTILKDVSGISINGAPIEKYTPEVGVQLLSIRDFREKVRAYADEAELFREHAEESIVKS